MLHARRQQRLPNSLHHWRRKKGEIPGKRHCSASKNGRQASASRCRRFPIFFRVRLLRLRGIEKRTPIYRTLTHLVQINRCPRLLVPWILRLTCLRGRRKQGKYVWKGGTVRVRCRHRASVAEFIRFLGQDRVWRSCPPLLLHCLLLCLLLILGLGQDRVWLSFPLLLLHGLLFFLLLIPGLGQDRVWRSLQLLARDVCNPALLQMPKCKCTVKIAPRPGMWEHE